MRFSTYFALSSSGATLSASNSRSRFCALSPRWVRGSTLGGPTGLGSGSIASASAGKAHAVAAAITTKGRNRRFMPRKVAPGRGTIKTDFIGAAVQAAGRARRRRSALAGLEAALDLVDHIDPALAPDQAIVAVAAAQGFQGVADFHGSQFQYARPRGVKGCRETRDAPPTRQHAGPAAFPAPGSVRRGRTPEPLLTRPRRARSGA